MSGLLTLRIVQDEHPESPRDWDNLGTMVCFHPRYKLGDTKHGFDPHTLSMASRDTHIGLELHLYDHSGLAISTRPFASSWDTGIVGMIVVSIDKARQEFGQALTIPELQEVVLPVLRQEVSTYNQYLQGDVWGYVVEDSAGNVLDACWGFFGHDFCKKEGEDMLAYYSGLEEKERSNGV